MHVRTHIRYLFIESNFRFYYCVDIFLFAVVSGFLLSLSSFATCLRKAHANCLGKRTVRTISLRLMYLSLPLLILFLYTPCITPANSHTCLRLSHAGDANQKIFRTFVFYLCTHYVQCPCFSFMRYSCFSVCFNGKNNEQTTTTSNTHHLIKQQ